MEQQFEKVKTLIRAKRYDDARQILETLNHPKAHTWLQKLDEISPRPQVAAYDDIKSDEELFAEVSDYLRYKQFDDARRILMTMNHPKAKKWLMKLDEIAPVAPSSASSGPKTARSGVAKTVDGLFDEASALIRERRFEEARQILEGIDDSKAQKWLQRIETLEPYAAPPDESHEDSEPESYAKVAQPKKEKSKLRWGEPWNPSPGGAMAGILGALTFFMPFIVTPLINVYLSLNWRRFGKPEWMQVSLAASLAAGIGFWIALPVMASSGRFSYQAILGILLFLAGISLWLNIVMSQLQKPAYKAWKEQGNPDALYQHEYSVLSSSVMYGLGVAFFMVGLLVFFTYKQQPHTFTDTAMTLEYPGSWSELNIQDVAECQLQLNGGRCVAAFEDGSSTGLIILEADVPSGMALKEVDLRLWEAVGPLQASLKHKTEIQIDGRPAIAREYSFKDLDGTESYAFMIVVVNGSKYYDLFFYSLTQESFERDRKEVEGLYTTINFTPQT